MNAQFVPALTAGVVPTIQLSVDEFAAVHPLAAKVDPFSKPPSPVGEIKVVCPHPTLALSKQDNNKMLKRTTLFVMNLLPLAAKSPFRLVFIIHFVF